MKLGREDRGFAHICCNVCSFASFMLIVLVPSYILYLFYSSIFSFLITEKQLYCISHPTNKQIQLILLEAQENYSSKECICEWWYWWNKNQYMCRLRNIVSIVALLLVDKVKSHHYQRESMSYGNNLYEIVVQKTKSIVSPDYWFS